MSLTNKKNVMNGLQYLNHQNLEGTFSCVLHCNKVNTHKNIATLNSVTMYMQHALHSFSKTKNITQSITFPPFNFTKNSLTFYTLSILSMQ